MNADYVGRAIDDIVDAPNVLPVVLAAIAAARYDQVSPHLTSGVILEIRGFPEINGSWQGRDAVLDAMRANYAKVFDQRPVIESTVQSGYTTAILFREDGRLTASGLPYSVRVALWLTFDGPQIARIEEICAPAAV